MNRHCVFTAAMLMFSSTLSYSTDLQFVPPTPVAAETEPVNLGQELSPKDFGKHGEYYYLDYLNLPQESRDLIRFCVHYEQEHFKNLTPNSRHYYLGNSMMDRKHVNRVFGWITKYPILQIAKKQEDVAPLINALHYDWTDEEHPQNVDLMNQYGVFQHLARICENFNSFNSFFSWVKYDPYLRQHLDLFSKHNIYSMAKSGHHLSYIYRAVSDKDLRTYSPLGVNENQFVQIKTWLTQNGFWHESSFDWDLYDLMKKALDTNPDVVTDQLPLVQRIKRVKELGVDPQKLNGLFGFFIDAFPDLPLADLETILVQLKTNGSLDSTDDVNVLNDLVRGLVKK